MQLGFWPLAKEQPDTLALLTLAADGSEVRRLTAGELLASANQLVHGLRALGLKAGDTIATVLRNEAAMIEVVLAATQAGLYVTPINLHLAAPEIAYILADSDAKAVIVSGDEAEGEEPAAFWRRALADSTIP